MKTSIIIAALASVVASSAFAQSATVTNSAIVGPQANVQTGDYNFGANAADLSLYGQASSHGSFAVPGSASTANFAGTGAQMNMQTGGGNFGLNYADINMRAYAKNIGGTDASVAQEGFVTEQLNDQFGYGNVGLNIGRIDTTGRAIATPSLAKPKPICGVCVPVKTLAR